MLSFLRVLGITSFLLAPSFVFAASASIGALSPSATVGPGVQVTFSLILSGFSSPRFTLIDSFAGGAGTSHLDSGGNFYWTPNNDDIGTHSLTITVSDSLGASATASQTITVSRPGVSISTPTPSGPVRFGTPVSFTASSVGFLSPVYSIEDPFFNSSISSFSMSSAGSFYWTPLLKDVGVHKLVVSARDQQGHYASTTQVITVEGLPSVSVLDAPQNIAANSKLQFNATAVGFVSPTIAVTDLFYTNRATSTLKLEGGKLTWTPLYNDIGVHTFVVSVTDSAGRQASTQVSVTVGPPSSTSGSTITGTVTTSVPASAAPTKTTPSYVFKSFLTVGSSGAEVTALQNKLIGLGLLSGSATGYFGQLTKKAVQAFQKSKGLEQVGFTGPGTRAALNK